MSNSDEQREDLSPGVLAVMRVDRDIFPFLITKHASTVLGGSQAAKLINKGTPVLIISQMMQPRAQVAIPCYIIAPEAIGWLNVYGEWEERYTATKNPIVAVGLSNT